jgi:hypothetical protein
MDFILIFEPVDPVQKKYQKGIQSFLFIQVLLVIVTHDVAVIVLLQ